MRFRPLKQELRWDESQALDFRDIRRILDQRGGKSHGLRAGYVDLESVKGEYTLERFLPKQHNACCVLLTTRIGGSLQRHWTALLRNSHGMFFFDSLNLKSATMTKILGDGGKFVNFLKKIKANTVNKKLQESHKMVRTCGLHVCVRVFCWQMSNTQYLQYLLSATNCVSPDKLVALMTIIGHL